MTQRMIRRICHAVCKSETQCPVYGAMRWFAGNRTLILCDCNSGKGKCPLREALELAAKEEKRATKGQGFCGGKRPCVLCKRDRKFCPSCKIGWHKRNTQERIRTIQSKKNETK